MATAIAIASIVSDEELHEDYVVPDAFDERVVEVVAKAVSETAIKMGITR